MRPKNYAGKPQKFFLLTEVSCNMSSDRPELCKNSKRRFLGRFLTTVPVQPDHLSSSCRPDCAGKEQVCQRHLATECQNLLLEHLWVIPLGHLVERCQETSDVTDVLVSILYSITSWWQLGGRGSPWGLLLTADDPFVGMNVWILSSYQLRRRFIDQDTETRIDLLLTAILITSVDSNNYIFCW